MWSCSSPVLANSTEDRKISSGDGSMTASTSPLVDSRCQNEKNKAMPSALIPKRLAFVVSIFTLRTFETDFVFKPVVEPSEFEGGASTGFFQIYQDVGNDAAWIGGHDEDSVGEPDGLVNVVGYE